MKWNIITLMDDMIHQGLSHGVVGKAFEKDLGSYQVINPREFTTDVHQTVDDRPFGGGDGMLMMADPLQKTLDSLDSGAPCYYLSPQGKTWTDSMALEMSEESEVTLLCGRYGGVDQRFLEKNKIKEISIGDYVLSGGELAALVLIDSVMRKKPGVLGHVSSASEDSFSGHLLEAPYFTRPQEWGGLEVPRVLLSGDHKKIREFRSRCAQVVTLLKRPDLYKKWFFEQELSPQKQNEGLTAFLKSLSAEEKQVLGFDEDRVTEALGVIENG